MARPPIVLPESVIDLIVEWQADRASLRAIRDRLASLDPPVVVSSDTVRRTLRRRGVPRVLEPVAKRHEPGTVGRCEGCSSTAEAHQCWGVGHGGRWRIRVGWDGLVACPTCRERLAPDVVADHLGLRGGLRSMTDEEHAEMDVRQGPGALDLSRVSW